MTDRDGGYVVPADAPNAVAAGLKKNGVGSRSWILMDSSGQQVILDVDKYAIMHRVHIQARDLRILDPLLSCPPAILGREGAIVLNLEHIKAIITADEVLLRDPLDDNVIPIVEDLRRRLKCDENPNGYDNNDGNMTVQNDVEAADEDDYPFEFRVLEVALEAICSYLAARTIEVETAVHPALDLLTSKISSRNVDRVLKLRRQITRLTARVQKMRDELERLMEDDDDMARLYLSRKKMSSASPLSGSGAASSSLASTLARGDDENDVEELQMLLEAYFTQIDDTLNKLTTLRVKIKNTEDMIKMKLQNHRNRLIQLELVLTSITVCLSIFSLVTSIFGMNIPYPWNKHHGFMFKWVVILLGVLCAIFFVLFISYARHRGFLGS